MFDSNSPWGSERNITGFIFKFTSESTLFNDKHRHTSKHISKHTSKHTKNKNALDTLSYESRLFLNSIKSLSAGERGSSEDLGESPSLELARKEAGRMMAGEKTALSIGLFPCMLLG